jgi:hypothetical protein
LKAAARNTLAGAGVTLIGIAGRSMDHRLAEGHFAVICQNGSWSMWAILATIALNGRLERVQEAMGPSFGMGNFNTRQE